MERKIDIDMVTNADNEVVIRECCCFFFQAEDGIRDLVRSRGLGDVYKRQVLLPITSIFIPSILALIAWYLPCGAMVTLSSVRAVSYTHLTLPTIYSV